MRYNIVSFTSFANYNCKFFRQQSRKNVLKATWKFWSQHFFSPRSSPSPSWSTPPPPTPRRWWPSTSRRTNLLPKSRWIHTSSLQMDTPFVFECDLAIGTKNGLFGRTNCLYTSTTTDKNMLNTKYEKNCLTKKYNWKRVLNFVMQDISSKWFNKGGREHKTNNCLWTTLK